MKRIATVLGGAEKSVAVASICLASLLPTIAMFSRQFGWYGIPASIAFVQQLTICMAFLGAALAASSDRLLGMSANTFLPARWSQPARTFASGLTVAISASLC